MSKESRISNEGRGSNRDSNNKPPHKTITMIEIKLMKIVQLIIQIL